MKETQGYCVKCKASVTIKDAVKKIAANGRAMMQGICPHCSTKVTKFIKG
jgi:DNA-directed RNA polymerase subunit RPC12/RpoP